MADHLARRLVGVAGLAALAGLFAALASARVAPTPPGPPDPRPLVVASLYPLELLAREIGGERIATATLVPPGASPHVFEPRPADLALLARARGFLRVGGGLDGWTEALLGAAASVPQPFSLLPVEAADGGRHAHGEGDPHVWLDPLAVRDIHAPALASYLARLDPAGEAYYRARLEGFVRRLSALDAELRALLGAAPQRRYVAFHNAWRHFGRRYGLEEIGVVQESPGSEPTPRALARLVTGARRAGLAAIFVEPQLPPRSAALIAAESGASTVTVDPVGDPSDPERNSYEGLLRFNARAFARALGGAPS